MAAVVQNDGLQGRSCPATTKRVSAACPPVRASFLGHPVTSADSQLAEKHASGILDSVIVEKMVEAMMDGTCYEK